MFGTENEDYLTLNLLAWLR